MKTMSKLITFCFPLMLVGGFYVSAEAQVSEKKGPSQEEIEKRLSELLDTLPEDKSAKMLENEPESPTTPTTDPESQTQETIDVADEVPNDVISQLEAEIEEINKVKRTDQTNEQRKRLMELRARLKVANRINGQLTKTNLTKSKINRGPKTEEDSFVIATIDVGSKSQTADIRFASHDGESGCTDDLYKFLAETPKGGYRDYRIIGRYTNSELAGTATQIARKEYDTMKERERQMIAYIQARERAMSRVRFSRRC